MPLIEYRTESKPLTVTVVFPCNSSAVGAPMRWLSHVALALALPEDGGVPGDLRGCIFETSLNINSCVTVLCRCPASIEPRDLVAALIAMVPGQADVWNRKSNPEQGSEVPDPANDPWRRTAP